ncbi:hypothetical protein L596_014791 [Steinernema carpocapsae]|uniref:Uncharacterized protein n=1 Tax=Steinernema carpocapsae TaxID=34508 RepID=A0A4U5NDS8_STECR|nr:hypothetical protein L596_014791 [Steinernema carpocapsae]
MESVDDVLQFLVDRRGRDSHQETDEECQLRLPAKAPAKGAPDKQQNVNIEDVLHPSFPLPGSAVNGEYGSSRRYDQPIFKDDDGCNTDTENSGEFSDDSDKESSEDLDVAGHVVDPAVLDNIIVDVLEWIHESDNEVLKQFQKEFVEVLRDPSSFLRPYPSWGLRSTMYYRKWLITKRDLWLFLNAHSVQTDNLQSVQETLFLLLRLTSPYAILTVQSCKQNSLKQTANLSKGWEEEIEDLIYVARPDYTRFCPYRWLRHYLNLCSSSVATGMHITSQLLFSGISKQYISWTIWHSFSALVEQNSAFADSGMATPSTNAWRQ